MLVAYVDNRQLGGEGVYNETCQETERSSSADLHFHFFASGYLWSDRIIEGIANESCDEETSIPPELKSKSTATTMHTYRRPGELFC